MLGHGFGALERLPTILTTVLVGGTVPLRTPTHAVAGVQINLPATRQSENSAGVSRPWRLHPLPGVPQLNRAVARRPL